MNHDDLPRRFKWRARFNRVHNNIDIYEGFGLYCPTNTRFPYKIPDEAGVWVGHAAVPPQYEITEWIDSAPPERTTWDYVERAVAGWLSLDFANPAERAAIERFRDNLPDLRAKCPIS